jgi:hypothetical protein
MLDDRSAPLLIEELTAAPVCARLHPLKDIGETKLEGSTLFNTPKMELACPITNR